MKKIWIAAIFFFLLFSKAGGQVQGMVADGKKIPVSNALIRVTDSLTQKMDTTRTDKRGFYAFKNLTPGKYRIEVKAEGFQNIKQSIEIVEGETGAPEGEEDLYTGQRIDFILKPVQR